MSDAPLRAARSIEAIRDRMVTEMGACGKPEDCHRAVGGCCALADATIEYQQGISDD